MWKTIGQDRALSLLRRGLETGAVANAYLITGPAGVGKMTLGLDVAAALNCTGDAPPCGECPSCQRIKAGIHADIRIIGLESAGDGESGKAKAEISIEKIRELQHTASLPPFEGPWRVVIVNGAELLSLEAANSLLKTLEEPVGKTLFLLLTANRHLLPETVVSRCQSVELTPVPAETIERYLVGSMGTDPENAVLLARLSHGCPGKAIAAAGDESVLNRHNEWVDEIIDVTASPYDERFTWAAGLAAGFGKDREPVYERLALWLDWWRDLLLVRAGAPDTVTNIDRLETLSRTAEGLTLEQIRETIGKITAAGTQLRQNANPRLVLEVLMLAVPLCGEGAQTAA